MRKQNRKCSKFIEKSIYLNTQWWYSSVKAVKSFLHYEKECLL